MGLQIKDQEKLEEFISEGKHFQAWNYCQALPPFSEWETESIEKQLLRERLRSRWGAVRSAMAQMFWMYRRNPKHPKLIFYHLFNLYFRRGPWESLEFIRRMPELETDDIETRAEYYALQGGVWSEVRDFDEMNRCFELADALDTGLPWLPAQKAWGLMQEDHYEEALVMLDVAFTIRPWYASGVNLKARLLGNLGRHEEAIAFLQEASKHLECGDIQTHLAAMLIEKKRLKEAEEAIFLAERYTPLPERGFKTLLASQRSLIACHREDYTTAVALLEPVPEKETGLRTLLGNLKNRPTNAKKKLLEVPFVQQHYATCSPATLSALAKYWEQPVEHLDVVESICYDGTPAARERTWAIEQGFIVREFTMTWEATMALIDRGIPFTVTTTAISYAHLQGVMGYDEHRGTLLIREPSFPHVAEIGAKEFFEQHAPTGPRSSLLLPQDQAALLEGIDLPDAELYDDYYEVQKALLGHQREEAVAHTKILTEKSPKQLLTLLASFSIACYDNNLVEEIDQIREILTLYPESDFWKYRLFCSLQYLGHKQEAVDLIEPFVHNPKSDPSFRMSYAVELRMKGRHDEAIRLLRRAIRQTRNTGRFYSALGDSYWAQYMWDKTLLAYQIASSLDDKNEQTTQSYYTAACLRNQKQEAYARLVKRFEHYGRHSGNPAQTLFWACETEGQVQQGFSFIQQALQLRPDDGELILFAADAYARWGHPQQAASLLREAKGKSKKSRWLETAADMAQYEGHLNETLGYLKEAIALDPLAKKLHHKYVDTLDKIEGRDAVDQYLSKLVEQFPYQQDFLMLRLFWLDKKHVDEIIAFSRQIIELHPANTSARQVLVFNLIDRGKLDEAETIAQDGMKLDPHAPFSYLLVSRVCKSRGNISEAKELLTKAIQLNVDYTIAVQDLVAICKNKEERRKAIKLIAQELQRQISFGDTILAFADLARGDCSSQEIKKVFVDFHQKHPDLWHAWVSLIQYLVEIGEFETASDLAEQASEQFPLTAAVWFARARACRFTGNRQREEESLQKASMVSPGDIEPLLSLCSFYERYGEWNKVTDVVQRAIAIAPNHPHCLNAVADTLWRNGNLDEAIEKLQLSLKISPSNNRAWEQMHGCAADLGTPEMVLDLARTIAQEQSNNIDAWLTLVSILEGRDTLQERLAVVDRAIALSPMLSDPYLRKVELLVELGEIDQAFATCRPEIFGENRPIELEAQEAWIHAVRGNLDFAAEFYYNIVQRYPSYVWVWSQLCDIYERQEKFGFMQQSATRLIECAPLEPAAHKRLANALSALGQKKQAKETLERVLGFAPDYTPAAFDLIDLYLADNEQGEAEELIKRSELYFGENDTAYWTFQLTAKRFQQEQKLASARKVKRRRRKEVAAASQRHEDLLRHAATKVWGCLTMSEIGFRLTSQTLLKIYQDWSWLPWLEKMFCHDVVDRTRPPGPPSHNISLLAECIHQQIMSGQIDQAQHFLSCHKYSNVEWEKAIEAFLLAFGDIRVTKKTKPYFSRQLFTLLDQYEARLTQDDHLWGLLGYAYNSIGDHRKAIDWLSNWKSRSGTKGWMLDKLVHSLYATGQREQAIQISRHVCDNLHYGMQDLHEAWLVFHEIFDSPLDSFEGRFGRINQETFQETHRALTHISWAIFTFRQAAESGDRNGKIKAYQMALNTMSQFETWFQKDAFSRKVRRKIFLFFLKHGPGHVRSQCVKKILSTVWN